MVKTRIYDDRMLQAQRQGKTSFYMRCTGEEAIAVGQALELGPRDMFFPTYRQQGWLIARDWPLVDMMCQIFSNEKDRLHGRQMPVMYSARDAGFFSISGNLGTQFIQAVGWAMAAAIKGDTASPRASSARARRPKPTSTTRSTFADHVPGAGDLERGQQPVGDLVVPGHRRRRRHATFAARAIGYGIPPLRVDGNDYLAVLAATRWARERARTNHGPTLIEWVTYRAAPTRPRTTRRSTGRWTSGRRGRSATRSSG